VIYTGKNGTNQKVESGKWDQDNGSGPLAQLFIDCGQQLGGAGGSFKPGGWPLMCHVLHTSSTLMADLTIRNNSAKVSIECQGFILIICVPLILAETQPKL
jgi:hypothetical protein